MSQYLIIKKNGVTLGEWSRSTAMYDAFGGAPYGEKQEFDPEDIFEVASSYLKDKIRDYQKTISKFNRMLEGNLGYEERWDCLTAIEELEEEIKNHEYALHDIDFMQNCWECDGWEEDPPVWTWMVS